MHKLPKAHRLHSRKAIQGLFTSGSKISGYPLRIIYDIHPNKTAAWPQVGVSVSKRKFSKAVDRNLLKRRMREAYRKNNDSLKRYCSEKELSINLFIIYLDAKMLRYSEIEKAIISLLQRLESRIENEEVKP